MKHLFAFLFIAGQLAAQQKVYWDTTRYQKFKTNLIVGIFQSYHNFNNEFKQDLVDDPGGRSHNHYKAESKQFTGIALTYDKFSLGLSIQSKPQDNSAGKGASNTFIASFNLGGNKWFIENSFRFFQGFYDSNSPAYDSTFKETGEYLKQPNFTNILARSKYLYFTNHKRYSFRANTTCNYRQLRTSGTWVFSANTNYNYLHNDSSFFPLPSRPYYGDQGNLNGFSSFGISMNAGAAFTLVFWKAFFFSMMFVGGPEQQWREYQYTDRSVRVSKISFSGDFRTAIGLNFKRCYFTSYTTTDFVQYNSTAVKLTNRSISGGVIFGWRFNSHVPEFYRKIQTTKLYLIL